MASSNYFQGTESIGAIVADFPGASTVFKEYRIDFCCGGDRLLMDVLKERQIGEHEFMAALNEMYMAAMEKREDETDWRRVDSEALINHIVNTHHAYLVRELPVLSEFTVKILRVHGQSHGELSRLHKLFHEMKTELEQHLISEEQVVFPLILEYEANHDRSIAKRAIQEIGGAEDEHEAVGNILKEIRSLTNQFTLPPEACRTYTLTFQKLEELESDLFQHIHLENNILFPRLSQ